METEDITFSNFSNLPIGGEGIGLAYIANYRVESFFTFGVRYVLDVVVGTIKHRAYKVVKTCIDPCKYSRGSLFYDIHFY